MKRLGLVATLAILASFLVAAPANAAIQFYLNDDPYWHQCFSQKPVGVFELQVQKAGSYSWTTVWSGTAWDDRRTEDGDCNGYAAGAIWAPKKTGNYSIRIFNTVTKKQYQYAKVQILARPTANYNNSQPQVQYVAMPNITGQIDGQLQSVLWQNGYKFTVASTQNIGTNARLSCLMSHQNVIQGQRPQAGVMVANTANTFVTPYVDCNW